MAFTDGLVERRDESIDAGLERLRALAAEIRSPSTICSPRSSPNLVGCWIR